MKTSNIFRTIFLAGSLLLQLSVLCYQSHGVTEAWVQRYSNVVSNSNDEALKIVRDVAGDLIVTGTTDNGAAGTDILTIKYSGASGTALWHQRYNGPANGSDEARGLAVDGSGNVVVLGDEVGLDSDGNPYTASYLVRYAAADGALLWEKQPTNSLQEISVDGNGNVIVSGSFLVGEDDVGNGLFEYYIAKYAAANGALVWQKSIPNDHQVVAVDGSDNVVVSGNFYNGTGNGNQDSYTAKYAAADGELLWAKSSTNTFQALAVDGSGNVAVTGYSRKYGVFFNLHDYYTTKYAAADGAVLWERRYDGPANEDDLAQAIAVDGSGNVVVTGYSEDGSSSERNDYYTAKYAAVNGALLWEKRYNGPANGSDIARAIAVDATGNVVVTGRSANGAQYSSDYYTAKYAMADGALLWEKRYSPGNGTSSLAVDPSGDVIVFATSYDKPPWDGGIGNYYTARYAAASGALLWEKRYNGASASYDSTGIVAVDGSGNVVVARSAYNTNNNADFYTAKYAAANGALLWEKRYNGPGNGDDRVSAMIVDGSGNVVVTGDSYTAKYAAVDGALLWEKLGLRYIAVAVDGGGNVVVTGSGTAKYAAANGALVWTNSPENFATAALALDASGNVVVTGTAYNVIWVGDEGGYFLSGDYYTAKYAAANGALLWERRYAGPADSDDQAAAVLVDTGGNVIVTGMTLSTNGSSASYTAKYAAADGALLWEKQLNGRANIRDNFSVALDSTGNLVMAGHGNGGTDIAKYATGDGALLWEKSISNSIRAVVDGSGNIVTTGARHNGTNNDYYTAKYAATDGALLWEKHYNGPANGDDFATRLALGPDGMVAVTGWSFGNSGSGIPYEYATIVYRETLPSLSIVRSNAIVIVSWPVTGLTFQLQGSTNLSSGNWFPVAQSTITNAGHISVTVPISGTKFFRLKSP